MIDNFCLIIGSGKCGTTSLFSYLAQHPQVSACTIKEPSFFAEDRIFNQGLNWYYGLWNWNRDKHKVALEASTSYTKIPIFNNVAEKISQSSINASFKFIYLMRNPLEKIESHFRYSGIPIPNSDQIEADIIETSRYAKQLNEYYARFPANTILLLNFEDLKTNPLNLLQRVCNFLEIDPSWNFQGLNTVYNASQDLVFNDPLWQALKKIKFLRSFAQYVPYKQKKLLHRCFGQKREFNHKLYDKQREFVLAELQPDLIELHQKYGVDLKRWLINIG